MDALNDLPIKVVNGATVYIRDIGHVRDGSVVQQNMVRADGEPSVLLTIMKTGSVSTLDIVDEIKERILPVTRAAAPPGMQIRELFDQSVFVRASIQGVLNEALSQPPHRHDDFAVSGFLAIHHHHRDINSALHSELPGMLSFLGHTMNVMTLGGLALAIGILVDDAPSPSKTFTAIWAGSRFVKPCWTAPRRSPRRLLLQP